MGLTPEVEACDSGYERGRQDVLARVRALPRYRIALTNEWTSRGLAYDYKAVPDGDGPFISVQDFEKWADAHASTVKE